MVKYNVNGRLYKISLAGLCVGGYLAGSYFEHLVETIFQKGKFGLEDLISVGGFLIAGSSIYYRSKCKIEYNKKLEQIKSVDNSILN
jgi:hypothetical protein